jgi:cyclase
VKLKHWIPILAVCAAPAFAQQNPVVKALSTEWPEIVKVDGIEILRVQKNIYMLVGGGANIAVQVGDEGVMVVDSGAAGQTDKIIAAIRHITRKPIRYMVNTTADADKTMGNEGIVKAAGGLGGVVAGASGRPANAGVVTFGYENSVNRMMSGGPGQPKLSGDAIPLSTFFTPKKEFYSNGEAVQLLHQANALTDGDLFAFFRGTDVVAAGDIFRTDSYPVIDPTRGGSIQGEIEALNVLLDICIPERNQMGGTRVIPGHGRISNEADVLEYRDMLTIIRDRVAKMAQKDMTAAQIKALHPTLEYDGLYSTKEMSGDMLIDLIYSEVTKKK